MAFIKEESEDIRIAEVFSLKHEDAEEQTEIQLGILSSVYQCRRASDHREELKSVKTEFIKEDREKMRYPEHTEDTEEQTETIENDEKKHHTKLKDKVKKETKAAKADVTAVPANTIMDEELQPAGAIGSLEKLRFQLFLNIPAFIAECVIVEGGASLNINVCVEKQI
ncbi:hypothetical protein QQF64_026233 [Cirrhinus molitorella]|uniref:Uncharacterized protein n=1 Tax=Cirrhinus molitorella TaxID=172907 RepID=A0ABR3NRP8_9TELE